MKKRKIEQTNKESTNSSQENSAKKQKIPQPQQPVAQPSSNNTTYNQIQVLMHKRNSINKSVKKTTKSLENLKQDSNTARRKIKNKEHRLKILTDRQTKIRTKIASLQQTSQIPLSDTEASGMTHQHSLTLSKFSAANDIIVVWRPINERAAHKLDSFTTPYMGKGLNTKGKSSEFGPIAGDIPCDAGLSKVAVSDPSHIAEFNKKNIAALQADEEKFQAIKNNINGDTLQDINEQLLVTEVNKKTEKGEEIFYFKNDKGDILWNESHSSPLFAIRSKTNSNNWLVYDDNSKTYKPYHSINNSWKPSNVKVMAYRQFNIVDNEVKESIYPITADYDELVSTARKIFPFHNNEAIKAQFNQELYKMMANSPNGMSKDQLIELASQMILSYEEKEKYDHREVAILAQQKSLGAVNDWQRAAKVHLKIETKGATNHGPEVNNPFPEKFTEGNYAVHMPNGSVQILKNEKEICKFINAQRQQGFPLDINPKWGWEKDEKGNLFVPDHRLNWSAINEELASQYATLQSKEEALSNKLFKLGIKDTEKNRNLFIEWWEQIKLNKTAIKKFPPFDISPLRPKYYNLKSNDIKLLVKDINEVRELTCKHADEVEILQNRLAIERLTMEPDIIYSEYINNKGQQANESQDEKSFRESVCNRVKELEHQRRFAKIESMKASLEKDLERFVDNYQDQSILQLQEQALMEKRQPTQQRTNSAIPRFH